MILRGGPPRPASRTSPPSCRGRGLGGRLSRPASRLPQPLWFELATGSTAGTRWRCSPTLLATRRWCWRSTPTGPPSAAPTCPRCSARLGDRVRPLHLKDGPIDKDPDAQLPLGDGRDAGRRGRRRGDGGGVPVLEFDGYAGDLFEGSPRRRASPASAVMPDRPGRRRGDRRRHDQRRRTCGT